MPRKVIAKLQISNPDVRMFPSQRLSTISIAGFQSFEDILMLKVA